MRFALIIEPSVADSVDRLAPLRERIAHAGFNIVRLRAGATLLRDLARAVDATDAGDSALVCIAGDVVLAGDAIALRADPPVPLSAIATISGERGLAQLAFVI